MIYMNIIKLSGPVIFNRHDSITNNVSIPQMFYKILVSKVDDKTEILAFVLYFVLVIGIGIYFFVSTKNHTEAEYFLGGRKMGPWVTALSAQASDMSAWLLMGLPGSILAFGLGQAWIGIGLAIGTALNWIIVAKRLRKFSVSLLCPFISCYHV